MRVCLDLLDDYGRDVDISHRLWYTFRTMEDAISYTLWPSLYDISHPTAVTSEAWADVVKRMSVHDVISDKDRAKGFGPYTLLPVGTRKDASVEAMTMAVFDVDQGGKEDVERCERLLHDYGARRLWYSSYSHSANKPALRLILPFSKPLDPRLWPYVRADLLEEFCIPAAPDKCTAASHFYFLPSKPTAEAPSIVASADGNPLDTDGWLKNIPPATREAALAKTPGAPSDWVYIPPTEPSGDLGIYTASIRKRITSLRRRPSDDEAAKHRADLLEHILKGEALAAPGDRNLALRTATHALVYAVPEGITVAELVHLLRPAMAAMQPDREALERDEHTAERLLLGAMRLKAYREHTQRTVAAALASLRDQADSTRFTTSTPVIS